jgi:hypothetical protein
LSIKVASGSVSETSRVLREIEQPDIKVVLYFFSAELASSNIQLEASGKFPGVPCVGASMIGGWASGGPVAKGIVAMSLSAAEVDEAFVASTEGVKKDPVAATRRVLADMKRKLGARKLHPAEYVGIILFDGLCLGEEIMRELAVEEDFVIPLVGGAAADELAFKETFVAADRTLSKDGVVLLVMKMRVPFYYNHYVHYVPTKTSVVVTKAEPARRIVWEIDGQPAAPYYAKLLSLGGIADVDHIHFARNPFGVCIGDTVYVRSPNAIVDGVGLQFYCYIEAGTRVNLLKQGDILENARSALREVRSNLSEIQGAILFNCVLRYLEIKELRAEAAFNETFAGIPFVGFNTYGEELFTHHNQTLTALFIGS